MDMLCGMYELSLLHNNDVWGADEEIVKFVKRPV